MATSLKRSAYEHIRENLLCGKLPPGTILSPVGLAKQLGISHTPVREAISQLESEGLIEQLPRLGARVKVIDRQELVELFELREMLESGAAGLAAERITPEQLVTMRHLAEQYADLARQYQEVAKRPAQAEAIAGRMTIVDVAFHLQLLSAAHNRRMQKIVGDLHLLTYVFRYSRPGRSDSPAGLKRMAAGAKDHGRIVQALERHNASAAAALVAGHIRGAKEHQLQMLDSLSGTTAGADAGWPEHVLRLIGDMERGPKAPAGRRARVDK
jgi:DNA-binding GntR family transcriptional regulator